MKNLKHFLLLFVLLSTLHVGFSLKCYSCNMNGEAEPVCQPEIVTCGNHDNKPSSEYSCVSGDKLSVDTFQLFVLKGCLNSADELHGAWNKRTCDEDLCNDGRNVYNGETKRPILPGLNSDTSQIASNFLVTFSCGLTFLFTTTCF